MATAAATKQTFLWEGKDSKGQVIKGEMSSKSPDLIKAQLRRQGITPTKVKKQRAIKGGSSKITAGDIAIFARQLTTMMASGVPLVQALIVAFIVTAILLVFVVPQFETLFEGVGSDLPAFTKMVVSLSEFMQAWWMVIFGAIGGFVFFLKTCHKKSQKFRDKVDALVLKMPVIGEIMHKAATSKFARTLATMSSAGVPLVEAMDSVAGAAGNAVYRDAVLRMKDDTATGQRLTATMRDQALFSNMAVQMVAIGEESGALDEMLSKVADYYEEEVDNAVEGLTSLMEPMIMAFLGIVVGGLVVAMYLPIFKMGDAF